MPIYSQTRTGTSGNAVVEAAKGYFDAASFGRIMYENEINDLALFEAAIGMDFAEAQGLREGTILESELSDRAKASAKKFFESLKEKVKKFWTKVRGIFATAIAQVSAFVVRDGRAFVKLHRDKLLKGDFNNVSVKYNQFDFNRAQRLASSMVDMANDIKSKDVGVHNATDSDALETMEAGWYKKIDNGVTKENFSEKVKEYLAPEREIKMDSPAVKRMMRDLEDGKDIVNYLKKCQKDADKALKEVISAIDEAAKKASSEAKEGDEKPNYTNASAVVSRAQVFVTNVSKTSITLCKKYLTSCRHALAKCIGFREAMEISSDRAFCEAYAYNEGKCAECDAQDALDADIDPDSVEDIGD